MLKTRIKPHHQDTKDTKFHKEKQGVNFVFLGGFGGKAFEVNAHEERRLR